MKKFYNILCGVFAVAIIALTLLGLTGGISPFAKPEFSDGVEHIDLDTIYLKGSKVEVNFSELILSKQNEERKLIVSSQPWTASVELTDRIIEKLDFSFMKKTQKVTYKGIGNFVVDLDKLTSDRIIDNPETKTLKIKINHARLDAIVINPDEIIIDEVKESLLARGKIKLTVEDYNSIEKELRARLNEGINTAQNGQIADTNAIKAVRGIYEPIVKAVAPDYELIIEFVN